MTVVVDTNVAIVANGRNADADVQCKLACIEKLESVVEHGVVAVDEDGEILREYANHLCYSGGPGVGDAFFKHVYYHQYFEDRVQRINVTRSPDDGVGYEGLGENDFDPSDRKFVAVALCSGAVILNATDSNYHESRTWIDRLGVNVEQLCPQHAQRG